MVKLKPEFCMGHGNTEMLKYKSVDSHVNIGHWKKVPFVFLIHEPQH